MAFNYDVLGLIFTFIGIIFFGISLKDFSVMSKFYENTCQMYRVVRYIKKENSDKYFYLVVYDGEKDVIYEHPYKEGLCKKLIGKEVIGYSIPVGDDKVDLYLDVNNRPKTSIRVCLFLGVIFLIIGNFMMFTTFIKPEYKILILNKINV